MLSGKAHRERAQPLNRRQKYGLLEKKKDYVSTPCRCGLTALVRTTNAATAELLCPRQKLRAADFHKKSDRLRALQEKAAMKNPDEFYMGMQNAQLVGKHNSTHRSAKKSMDAKQRKSNMAQDLGYATMKKVAEQKKVKGLKDNLHRLADAGKDVTHTLFFDDDADKKAFSPAEYFDTAPELGMRHHNRPRKATLASQPVLGLAAGEKGEKQLRKLLKTQRQTYQELEQREERGGKLEGLMVDISLEKAAMGKGRKRKLNADDGSSKTVFKWKKERKR